MLEFASYLDVDTILVIPGTVDVFFNPRAEVIPYDVAYERSLEALKELFIDKIGSEYVGAYFDVGNTLLTGYPEHWIRILNKRIKKVHIKDFRASVGNVNGFVDLLEGDVNWKEVIRALKDVGYDGYLTAEILPPYSQYPEALLYNTSKSMDFILGE